ncbi:carbohydrate ABC transporter permease [Quadrisphaera setariae]|uniref:Sugar ABC transporter permease n=1 Tax=Quadrisphaera setariae TaxID=2593304 RepID=A0A5C8YZL7_9ACTN|nr:sugar ABC transporter permease [Quadrisphaera setariae]TXR51305.1 sugar ABC transporter permease [Quadrisphaera setariae]
MTTQEQTGSTGPGASRSAAPHRRDPGSRNGRRGAGVRPRSALARSQSRWGRLLAAPAVVGFAVFTVGPMIASLVIGSTNWSIGTNPTWAGTENYEAIFADPRFYASLKATFLYALLAVPGTVIVAFLVATLMHQVRRGRGFFRTVFYLPVLVPPVASAVLWLWLFDPTAGLLNSALRMLHLPTSQWIYGESSALPSISLVAIWGFGNMALIFLAALQGVPRELMEAAEVDGAGPLRRTWNITLPIISPIILFNLITGFIAAVQNFDSAYIITNGGPNDATLFYVFYLYTKAFTDGQLGYASAMAWILFVVIVAITVVVFRTSRYWVYSEGSK